MRWFKHLTETRQDEKIAHLIADGGATAYASPSSKCGCRLHSIQCTAEKMHADQGRTERPRAPWRSPS